MDSLAGIKLSFAVSLFISLWACVATAHSHNCDNHLVSGLPQSAFSSSSVLSTSHSPGFAKLNRRDGAGGWSPVDSNKYQWLQIDLGERTEITAIATQGRYGSSDWVTSYVLMFSDTERNWKQYRQEDNTWAFPGNSNADSVVHYKLQYSIRARFLRFAPLKWNPNGRIGMRVEVYGCPYKSDVADFDGRSSLLYRFNQKSVSTVKDMISLKFKTLQSDGVMLHGEGQRGDYITLELKKSKLSLEINLGDTKLRSVNGHTSVTLGSLLDDQHWHSITIERYNKQVNFTVDKHTQHFRTKGEFDYLDIDYELSFGGIPVPGKSVTFLRKNFHGCIENLYYNGVNIIDLAKRRKPQIHVVGNVTFSCMEPHIVPVTFMTSSSYLLLPGKPQMDGLSVSFQFRTWNKDGLLLYNEFHGTSGVLQIYLVKGKLKITVHKLSWSQADITTGVNLNDGLWHSINLNARRNRVSIILDNNATSTFHSTIQMQIYSGSSYYFGGCPEQTVATDCLNPFGTFEGCMRLILIDNQAVDLILVQQGLQGNFTDLHIDLCGIQDRCLPNYCEHGGECSQSWNTFHCDCAGTGYTGETCHSSLYEKSCEAYRHRGQMSDFFSIDPDGSGSLKPLLVYCNMTEDKTWTVIQHNNTELTKVQGSSSSKPQLVHLSYTANREQLQAMINNMDYCEQEVSYHCRRSRLLNTPGGTPFTWWIGRTNEKQIYWGGSLPGVQKCACGLEESCLDNKYHCNCDADSAEWANDTGLLSYKDHLPLTQLIIGDTNRTGSEAAYKLGSLRCNGDNNYWNAASFNTKTSYLHFPTFHGELSADITFFFKTTASSGVFLENLGIKDFIRIELSWGTASRQKGFIGCIRALQLNGVNLDLEERAKMTPGVRPGCPGHCTSYGNLCHNGGRCIEKYNGYSCNCTPSAYDGPFCKTEVSALFKVGTSLIYNFQEFYGIAKNLSAHLSAIYMDKTTPTENTAFSFRTTQAPSILLYVDTYHDEYLAVMLLQNGSLQVRYRLANSKDPDIFNINSGNLADGLLHSVKIDREGPSVYVEIDHLHSMSYKLSSDTAFNGLKSLVLGKIIDAGNLDQEILNANVQGFVGCLSSVQFNWIAPLKVGLRHFTSAPVTVKGDLVESDCRSSMMTEPIAVTTALSFADHSKPTEEEAPLQKAVKSDSAVIGGVIAIVIFVILCIFAITGRLLYQNKGTYQNNEAKRTEYAEAPDVALKNKANYQDAVSEGKKEYFI
ncbi:contactin-associated protein-like 5 isoform X3 [Pristis pectinata]|uniref:contactin-associated protein-like 5 isoform X3 n=1 Tax=Pristis pectinata TaxID=685728 RepID=UPI00223CA1BF|nr:contactin-associated protein-like 5 isoform X3 [Pristis pectinata]